MGGNQSAEALRSWRGLYKAALFDEPLRSLPHVPSWMITHVIAVPNFGKPTPYHAEIVGFAKCD